MNNEDGWTSFEGIAGTRETPEVMELDPVETAAEVPELLELLA